MLLRQWKKKMLNKFEKAYLKIICESENQLENNAFISYDKVEKLFLQWLNTEVNELTGNTIYDDLEYEWESPEEFKKNDPIAFKNELINFAKRVCSLNLRTNDNFAKIFKYYTTHDIDIIVCKIFKYKPDFKEGRIK